MPSFRGHCLGYKLYISVVCLGSFRLCLGFIFTEDGAVAVHVSVLQFLKTFKIRVFYAKYVFFPGIECPEKVFGKKVKR